MNWCRDMFLDIETALVLMKIPVQFNLISCHKQPYNKCFDMADHTKTTHKTELQNK